MLDAILLSVDILSVNMLSVKVMSVKMLNLIIVIVNMLNAVMLKIIILSVNIHVRHYSDCEILTLKIIPFGILPKGIILSVNMLMTLF